MKRFKLKNKIISICGAFVMLGAFLASVFSGLFALDKQNNVNETHAEYVAQDYSAYANQVVADIQSKDFSNMEEKYSLKNDYPILAEDQTEFDLCWAFSGAKVLETTLMIAKGEYYNFSEIGTAYLAYLNGSNSAIKAMGSFEKFDLTMRRSGIVNESDFSNDIMFQINETNHSHYSYVTSLADKNIANEVVPIYLPQNELFAPNESIVALGSLSTYRDNVIKYYIKNYGALNIALPGNSNFHFDESIGANVYEYGRTSNNEGKPFYTNHAVTLIGWNKHGFIGLNSWGVDETNSYEEVVITYSTMLNYYNGSFFSESFNPIWLCGYKYVGGEAVSLVSSSASNFSNSTNGIVKNATNPMKNIFTLTKGSINPLCETINLKYKVNDVTSFETVYYTIYKGNEEVTSKIAYHYDNNAQTIELSWTPGSASDFGLSSTNFAGGTYVVRFYEDVELIATKTFCIYTGTEISSIKFSSDAHSNEYGTYYSNLNNFASSVGEETFYVSGDGTAFNLVIYLTDINEIKKSSETVTFKGASLSVVKVYNESTGNFETTTDSVAFTNSGNGTISGSSQNMITLQASFGEGCIGKLYNVEIYLYSAFYDRVCQKLNFKFFVETPTIIDKTPKYDPAFYDIAYIMDGGTNSNENIHSYPQNNLVSFTLKTPTRAGYEFEGWFTDAEFTNEIEVIDGSLSGFLPLYAKWRYSNTIYFTTELNVSNIYNYNRTAKDISGVDFSEGAVLTYGESIAMQSKFNMTDDIKNETFAFKYYIYVSNNLYKEEMLVTYADKGNVQSLYTLDFGGIGDDVLAFPNLEAGNYVVKVVSALVIEHGPKREDVKTFNIEVQKKIVNLKYDVAASTVTYDGKTHLPSVVFDSATYYSEDAAEFANLTFKQSAKRDAGTYDFSINDFSSDNYVLNADHKNQNYQLHISKKMLTLNWTVKSAVYNGMPQKPECTVVGKIEGDKVSINFDKNGYTNAGEYVFIVTTTTNQNYDIQKNQQVSFTITKAPLTVTFNEVEERAQKAVVYRKKITFTYNKAQLFANDKIEDLNIVGTSQGLTKMVAGSYRIYGSYDEENSNYEITWVHADYILTGYYYIIYTLPNGTDYKELVNYGETPKGIPEDIFKVSGLKKIKYDKELVETGDDIYVNVSVVNYTYYVLIGGAVVGFIVIYFIVSRKVRRNKVR